VHDKKPLNVLNEIKFVLFLLVKPSDAAIITALLDSIKGVLSESDCITNFKSTMSNSKLFVSRKAKLKKALISI
jgi:hypothetical protein